MAAQANHGPFHDVPDTPPIPRWNLRPYAASDLSGLLEVLGRVAAGPAPYPPRDAGSTGPDVAAWLNRDSARLRLVAATDTEVLGHVNLTDTHPYLNRHLASDEATQRLGRTVTVDLEVGRLFSDPLARQHGLRGVGRGLLRGALDWAHGQGLNVGLAVIDGSTAALALYDSAPMEYAGTFRGIHGVNHVYVATAAGEI